VSRGGSAGDRPLWYKKALGRGRDMKRLIKTAAIPAIGIVIVISGLVYDVLFAGIPYQDPTPELQARYDFHSSVAGWLCKAGGILFLAGLLAIPIILTKTRKIGAGKPLQDTSQ
jgi:hypothetical protein